MAKQKRAAVAAALTGVTGPATHAGARAPGQSAGDRGRAGMKRLKVTLRKSPIGAIPKHRRTVAALGLRRTGASTEKDASPEILGMVRSVAHLVEVEEIN